ncbi:alpha/beta hydrolase [Polaribacter sp. Hel_I_88]|uniref:alpha/beta hydrolase n=1 Tax=Polaribacter sp. Hel_I_88 TaxID=1250006 RepID=UPI000479624F|nr:alpha/beta hydrolase [Polaribacter sp. Hel_I_88]
MIIYGISGLGADKRVFQFLKLEHEFTPIDWIDPLKNESITEYAKRFSSVIDTSEKFCVLGVSFGGLIAVEINKFLNPELTILISSAETRNEIPLIYRMLGETKVVKIIPAKLLNPPRWIANRLFGTKQKKLLNEILNDTDLKFTKWAVQELSTWKNEQKVENVLKIVGTKDKLIPLKEDKNIHLIKGGGHLMIIDNADEVSKIINKEIKNLD